MDTNQPSESVSGASLSPSASPSPSPLKILELLSSRLCHELIGPVGAISNGVEFAEEVDDGAADAIGLIAESAGRAAGRLQFYRLAYGASGRSVHTSAALEEAISALVAYERTDLNWPVGSAIEPFLEKPGGAKLILIAIEIAQGALIRGGAIEVHIKPLETDETEISITAKGPRATIPAEVASAWRTVEDVAPDALSPRTVHCFYARDIAQQAGVSLDVSLATDKVCLTLK